MMAEKEIVLQNFKTVVLLVIPKKKIVNITVMQLISGSENFQYIKKVSLGVCCNSRNLCINIVAFQPLITW